MSPSTRAALSRGDSCDGVRDEICRRGHRHRAHDSIARWRSWRSASRSPGLAAAWGGSAPHPATCRSGRTTTSPSVHCRDRRPWRSSRSTGRDPRALVWADGGWEWSGERFRWAPGAWVAPPAGAKRARWVIVRREVDGQLFFAPSSWRDASGKPIDAARRRSRARARDPAAPLARAIRRSRWGPNRPGRLTAIAGVLGAWVRAERGEEERAARAR